MTVLIFFAIGFVLIIVAWTAGHILLAPLRALLNAIVGQIMERLELQKARLRPLTRLLLALQARGVEGGLNFVSYVSKNRKSDSILMLCKVFLISG